MAIIDDAKSLVDQGKITEDSIDLLSEVIQAVQGDPFAIAKIIYAFQKTPFLIRERLFYSKLESYLKGVYVNENDRGKLRKKLTENGSSDENSKRLIDCIDRAETSQKIQYLINATRCFLTDYIDRTTFFRVCRAITGTIDEGLVFWRDHIEKGDFTYSETIQGLFVSGLVTFSSIGGEPTTYSFTPLAKTVDQYAISYDDINRYPNPTVRKMLPAPNVNIPTVTNDEVQKMLDDTF